MTNRKTAEEGCCYQGEPSLFAFSLKKEPSLLPVSSDPFAAVILLGYFNIENYILCSFISVTCLNSLVPPCRYIL